MLIASAFLWALTAPEYTPDVGLMDLDAFVLCVDDVDKRIWSEQFVSLAKKRAGGSSPAQSIYWQRMTSQGRWCADCWENLHWARVSKEIDYNYRHLRELRNLLGNEAYYSGRMPPPVPIWLFRWID